ncbi:DNA binding [Microdochium nivale]|nr:DNA binding [Microdochium nivale]
MYAHDDRRPVMVGAFDSKKSTKMRPPMRSSIACLRCRKSKIKCENDGGSSPCDGCVKTQKQCIFQPPEGNPPPPKRVEPPAAAKQDRDGGSDRKRLKRIDEIAKSDGQKGITYAEEVLSAPFLTEDVWDQVLDLYKLHFAPELPFLHLPTMKERLGCKFRSPGSVDESPEFNLVLLGVLALTARFHADLVKYLAHISNNQPGNVRSRPMQTQVDPSTASEYYAEILSMALGPIPKTASVERVQAMLMLGLYEWGQTRPKPGGLGAWMSIGGAIRLAQFLNLGLVDDATNPSGTANGRSPPAESHVVLEREIKRRTMFGCFVLDRMLSCGKGRVTMIQRENLLIQLPCSEDKFDLAIEVNTGMLPQSGVDEDERRDVTDDSVLSRFIRLVDLWGDISKYTSAGGRFTEKYPPWDSRTTFHQLSRRLQLFDASLPGAFKFSESNYRKHENHQASSAYVLLHVLRCISLIMLHREYIPFVPIRCKGPEGPRDEPTFPQKEYDWPSGFWSESAECVFRAAKDIVELIEICERKNRLPQSTLVLFGIWTAAFIGLYAHHFPQMDEKQHMKGEQVARKAQPSTPQVYQQGPTAIAYNTLDKMSTWLKMASTYISILLQMDKYFVDIKQEFYKHEDRNRTDLAETARIATRRVRDGGSGGGLEEYEQMRPQFKEFGALNPADSDGSRCSTVDRATSLGAESQGPICTPKSTPSSFTAINHGHGLILPGPSDPTQQANGVYSDACRESWRHAEGPHARALQSPVQASGRSSSMTATQGGPQDNESIFPASLTTDELHAHENQRMHWDMDAWLCGDIDELPGHFWAPNAQR